MNISVSVQSAVFGFVGAMLVATAASASVGDVAQYNRYQPNPKQCRDAWVKVPTGATAPHKPKYVYRLKRVCFYLPKPRRIKIKRYQMRGFLDAPIRPKQNAGAQLAQYPKYRPHPKVCRSYTERVWVETKFGGRWIIRHRRHCFRLPKPPGVNIRRHRIGQ